MIIGPFFMIIWMVLSIAFQLSAPIVVSTWRSYRPVGLMEADDKAEILPCVVQCSNVPSSDAAFITRSSKQGYTCECLGQDEDLKKVGKNDFVYIKDVKKEKCQCADVIAREIQNKYSLLFTYFRQGHSYSKVFMYQRGKHKDNFVTIYTAGFEILDIYVHVPDYRVYLGGKSIKMGCLDWKTFTDLHTEKDKFSGKLALDVKRNQLMFIQFQHLTTSTVSYSIRSLSLTDKTVVTEKTIEMRGYDDAVFDVKGTLVYWMSPDGTHIHSFNYNTKETKVVYKNVKINSLFIIIQEENLLILCTLFENQLTEYNLLQYTDIQMKLQGRCGRMVYYNNSLIMFHKTEAHAYSTEGIKRKTIDFNADMKRGRYHFMPILARLG